MAKNINPAWRQIGEASIGVPPADGCPAEAYDFKIFVMSTPYEEKTAVWLNFKVICDASGVGGSWQIGCDGQRLADAQSARQLRDRYPDIFSWTAEVIFKHTMEIKMKTMGLVVNTWGPFDSTCNPFQNPAADRSSQQVREYFLARLTEPAS